MATADLYPQITTAVPGQLSTSSTDYILASLDRIRNPDAGVPNFLSLDISNSRFIDIDNRTEVPIWVQLIQQNGSVFPFALDGFDRATYNLPFYIVGMVLSDLTQTPLPGIAPKNPGQNPNGTLSLAASAEWVAIVACSDPINVAFSASPFGTSTSPIVINESWALQGSASAWKVGPGPFATNPFDPLPVQSVDMALKSSTGGAEARVPVGAAAVSVIDNSAGINPVTVLCTVEGAPIRAALVTGAGADPQAAISGVLLAVGFSADISVATGDKLRCISDTGAQAYMSKITRAIG